MDRSNIGASTNVMQILLDILSILTSFALVVIFGRWDFTGKEQIGLVLICITFIIVLVLANRGNYIYNVTLFYYVDRIFRKTFASFILAIGTTFLLVCYIGEEKRILHFYWMFVGLSFLFVAIKIFINRPLMRLLSKGTLPRTAFLGERKKFEQFNEYLHKTSILFDHVGYIARSRQYYDYEKEDYIGTAEDIEELIKKYHIDQIYIEQEADMNLSVTQKYLDVCMDMGVTVRFVMNFYKKRNAKSYVTTVGTYPIIVYHTIGLNNSAQLIKRIMDILGGIVGVVLTTPIMLFTALAIKLDSPGPVLFKQVRIGQNGRKFKIYKFRSMYTNAEEMKKKLLEQNEMQGGVMFKMQNDPRITKVGKLIRKFSIDELPQFFNVIGGSMSLVGTRPPTEDEVEKYKRNQWRRISIKPGLTGMWQVSGRSNIQNFEDIVEMDVDYIDRWSIWLDIKIIFKTVLVVLGHTGAC